MGLLDKLWDDTLAGPRPETGLGKLRTHYTFSFRSSSGKESDGGNVVRSDADESTLEATKVTRSIMIVKPSGYQSSSTPPVSPAGSTPPISPFSDGNVFEPWGNYFLLTTEKENIIVDDDGQVEERVFDFEDDLLRTLMRRRMRRLVSGDLLLLTTLIYEDDEETTREGERI